MCIGVAVWLLSSGHREQRLANLRDDLIVLAQGSGSESTSTTSKADRLFTRLRTLLAGKGAREHRQRMHVITALTALATELRAGHPPEIALVNAGGIYGVWPAAASATRFGADIAEALRVDARTNPALSALAACWQVGSVSGSGLARVVEELARSGRAGEDTRAQLDAQLASARASMRVLALLPILGIAMGTVLGAAPIPWFLGTSIGRLAFIAGVTLSGCGMWWSRRITRSVERLL